MRALSLLLAALWIGAAGPCPMGPGVPCPSGRQVTLGLTGGLPAGSTFTRAGNTATMLVNGVVTSVLANVARFPTDVNGKPLGYLNEPAATNLGTYSVPDGGTNWTYTALVPTVNATVAPDGSTTATQVVDNNTSSSHFAINASISFVSGTTYTFSLYVKAGTATAIQITTGGATWGSTYYANFNLSTGLVGTIGAGITSTSVNLTSNGWYRLSWTGTCPNSGTSPLYVVLTNSNPSAARNVSYVGSGQTLYVWGAQVEAGSFPTSYIATAGTAVTRNADNLTIALSAYPWWQTAMGWTVAMEFSSLSNLQTGTPLSVAGTGDIYVNGLVVQLNGTGGLRAASYVASSSYTTGYGTLGAAGTVQRMAISMTPALLDLSVNRGAPLAGAVPSAPKMLTLKVGTQGSGSGNLAGNFLSLTLRQGPSSAAWLQGGNY